MRNLIIIAIAALLLGIVIGVFALNVDVRVFQSHATGGLVYCRTGSLPATTHEDLGTASVSLADAVDCP